MPYLPTTPSYKPPHSPPPNSVPTQIHLLPTFCIHTLFILIITTPAILITVEGLSLYQQDIPCQLLVQLLHHVALAQLQHFRACPDDLPILFGLPLHTTLSVMRVNRLTSRSKILTLREVLTKRHCILKGRLRL